MVYPQYCPDEAYITRRPRIRIIHGSGTGALKNYVHYFLKTSDLIEKFEFAPSSKAEMEQRSRS